MDYMEKAKEALKRNMDKVKEIMDVDPNHVNVKLLASMVSISEGNRKTGKFPSVSLLPLITCDQKRCKGTCGKRCYAVKLCNIYPTVLEAYARNTAIFLLCPVAYWTAVENAMKKADTFRFHIAGDIPSRAYMDMIHYLCSKYPDCKTLMFTKRYEIVNAYMAENRKPKNLQIMFSGWDNLKPENPYNLPETTVYAKGEKPDPAWIACGGNCLTCRKTCAGCFNAKAGETVAFEIH